MGDDNSLLASIVKWAIIIVVAVVAIKIALGLLGIVLGLAAFLFFTVLPVLIVGWLLVKAWQMFTKEPA